MAVVTALSFSGEGDGPVDRIVLLGTVTDWNPLALARVDGLALARVMGWLWVSVICLKVSCVKVKGINPVGVRHPRGCRVLGSNRPETKRDLRCRASG